MTEKGLAEQAYNVPFKQLKNLSNSKSRFSESKITCCQGVPKDLDMRHLQAFLHDYSKPYTLNRALLSSSKDVTTMNRKPK